MELNYSLSWSITIFIVLTIGYGILKRFFGPKTPNDESRKNSGSIVLLLYMIVTFIVQLISNFSNVKSICEGSDQPFFKIFLYTVMPFFFIFGTIVILINIKKGWLNPFSNTIGYLIAMIIFKGNKSFNTILNAYSSDSDGDSEQQQMINTICKDKSLVSNELSEENYSDMMNVLFPSITGSFGNINEEKGERGNFSESKGGSSPEFETKAQSMNDLEKAYNSLFRMVLLKDIVAECVWFILAGCLAISIEANIITSVECDYDPATIKKQKEEAEKEHRENLKPQIKYTKTT